MLDRYIAEETALRAEIAALESMLTSRQERLQELALIREALSARTKPSSAKVEPARVAAPAATKPAEPPKAAAAAPAALVPARRGRKPGSKNKPKVAVAPAPVAAKAAEPAPIKRGPGRPKGSKNSPRVVAAPAPKAAKAAPKAAAAPTTAVEAAPAKRGPGRPKGSKNTPRVAVAAPAPAAKAPAKPAAKAPAKAAKPAAKPAPKAAAKPAAKPAPKAAAKPAAPGRRGRRPARAAGGEGIVDAAARIAREKGVKFADAGEIHHWFAADGFTTRDGVPSRNTINVSLNREIALSANRNAPGRVSRAARGQFAFEGN